MDDFPLLKALIEANSPHTSAIQKLFKETLKLTSVFDITRLTETDFKDRVDTAIKNDKTLEDDAATIDIGRLYDNVKCFAAQISHLYREKQLSGADAQHHWHPPGIRAIEKQGPTYTNLFKENWDDACRIDSIAAIDSPVAYLRALYLFAHQLQSSLSQQTGEKANRIPLKTRRPDLAKLSIDQQNTFTAQPMLKIVNDILSSNIQEALKTTSDAGKSTYEVLAQRRYPFALPYEFFHHQCLLGLSGKKPVLGELNYLISNHLPLTKSVNTQYGKVLNTPSDEAQRLMSGLGPQQQALLTEEPLAERLLTYTASAPLTPEERQRKDNHWKNNYGIASVLDLKAINTFLERTELNAGQVETLIAQGKYAPRQSPHYRLPAPHSMPYGARYASGPFPVAPMTLDKVGKIQKINGLTERRLERLHRMIRLQRWLDIPFAELDTLICSAFESQQPRNTSMQLDSYTVQALGVYRYLNRVGSIKAQEFAALLHQLSPYAAGNDTSLLDQVFNKTRLFDTPLLLDGRSFLADLADPASHTVLQHLSASLGLPLTEDSLLRVVNNTQKYLGPLKCDLPTLSSIYRQARIARLFGVSIADTATLAGLLGGESIHRYLATGNDSTTCTLRINVKQDHAYFELVALFQLPEHANPASFTRLLPGSSLTSHSPWFSEKDSPYQLYLSDPGDNFHLKINEIPAIGLGQTIALEGLSIDVTAEALYSLSNHRPLVASLMSTSSNNLDDAVEYINATLTHDKPSLSMLDVLMRMDWMTRWLNESVYDLPMLHRFLEPMGSNDHSFRELQQHLIKLHLDTQQCAVTPQALATLSLPENIDWRTVLAPTLLDDKGLVKNFAPAIEDDVPQRLDAALNTAFDALKLDEDPDKDLKLKVHCKRTLKDLLLLAHDRQLHLIEKLLQETSQLPMNCAKGVVIWAGTSAYQILVAALHTDHSVRLPPVLHPVLRHAEATVQLHLSNRALRLFLSHPDWLDRSNTQLKLTLNSLYLLDRFNHCIDTHQHAEESLLSYLELANSSATTTVINSLLAQLLNWTTAEVTVLTARLRFQTARTMRAVDWVMRCHNTCKATGLGATALLSATALDNQSPADAWRTVGEAVMATPHSSPYMLKE